MDFDAFIATLRCPDCNGEFDWAPIATSGASPSERDGRFGLLTCQCHRWPVLADIPVLMRRPLGIISHWNDGVVHADTHPDYLVALLKRGHWQQALLEAMVFPRMFPFQWRLSHKSFWPTRLARRAGLAITRRQLSRLLFARRNELTLTQWIGLFFAPRSGNNSYLGEYFFCKATTPRFLSAMALVQRLPASEKPVLDLSCGMGHFVRYLTTRLRTTSAIGLDFNFHQLWGARHLVAPGGWFVCADSGAPLPFRNDALAAITCADAFPYLPDKPMLVAEFARVAPERPVIIARTGYLGVGPANPPTGGELELEGYLELFGRERTRYFADTMLWKDYLERRDPLIRPDRPLDEFRWEKYLSFVTHADKLDPMPPVSEPRPHALGALQLNPVYEITRDNAQGTELTFMFATTWGAYEDADMAAYVQRWVSLEPGLLRRALSAPDSEEARELIERFVLIGSPAGAGVPALARFSDVARPATINGLSEPV